MNRIHLDAYTAAAAIVILAGIITLILAVANPVRCHPVPLGTKEPGWPAAPDRPAGPRN